MNRDVKSKMSTRVCLSLSTVDKCERIRQLQAMGDHRRQVQDGNDIWQLINIYLEDIMLTMLIQFQKFQLPHLLVFEVRMLSYSHLHQRLAEEMHLMYWMTFHPLTSKDQ